MPAQKRALSQNLDNNQDDSQDSSFRMQSQHQIEEHEREDFDGTQKLSPSDEKSEYTCIKLLDVRKLVQCPICLGIIKKTRTVMECMHRFCRECIDKSMRLGNNECPTCRTHCASRRSLRDDPRYDAIIAYLYEDINEYEEEELAYHEEEKIRNKQIQESIAQIIERQEAQFRKHTPAKDSASGYISRSQRNHRRAHPRPRPNHGLIELQADDTSEEENDGSKDRTSSANNLELNKESRGIFPGMNWKPEILAWGKGGTRSQTRHGSFSGSNSKSARTTRVHKIVEYLENEGPNDDELGIHVMLISLDKQNIPCLQKPFLCCDPSLPVKHLCEYLADQISLRAEEIQMLVLKKHSSGDQPSTCMDRPIPMPLDIDTCKDDNQVLEGHETLCDLKADFLSSTNYLILAYRKKET